MFRVRTIFTGVAGSPWYSNLFFQGGSESQASSAHEAVATFWEDLGPYMANRVLWTVQGDVADINPATGEIEDIVGVTPVSGSGIDLGQMLPPANQILVRLTTGVVRRNRLVQGRINIPGVLSAQQTVNGTLTSAVQTAIDGIAEDLRESEGGGFLNGLCVWARPRTVFGIELPGAACLVSSTQVNSEMAVLRSRRD